MSPRRRRVFDRDLGASVEQRLGEVERLCGVPTDRDAVDPATVRRQEVDRPVDGHFRDLVASRARHGRVTCIAVETRLRVTRASTRRPIVADRHRAASAMRPSPRWRNDCVTSADRGGTCRRCDAYPSYVSGEATVDHAIGDAARRRLGAGDTRRVASAATAHVRGRWLGHGRMKPRGVTIVDVLGAVACTATAARASFRERPRLRRDPVTIRARQATGGGDMKVDGGIGGGQGRPGHDRGGGEGAEDLGYDGIFTAETATTRSSRCSIAAEHTERSSSGPASRSRSPRNPMTLANPATTCRPTRRAARSSASARRSSRTSRSGSRCRGRTPRRACASSSSRCARSGRAGTTARRSTSGASSTATR